MAGKLVGKKVVVIAAQEFEELELIYPIMRLSEEGAEISLVPVMMGMHPRPQLPDKPVTGRMGIPLPIPTLPPGQRYNISKLEDITADALDLLYFPGGYSPDLLRQNQMVLDLVRECNEKQKLIGAICHAAWILISAGIVQGKQATGVAALRDDLINAGANYVDEPVVRDGNLIMSRLPNDLPDFCIALIQAIA